MSAVTAPQACSKCSARARNDQKWEAHKDEIHRIYIEEDNTLQRTMQIMATKGCKASERKWKMKLKEWNFVKYLNASDMNFVAVKGEKRAREEKETDFFHNGSKITTERIENFKRRNIGEICRIGSPSPNTPENITYHTPQPDSMRHSIERQQLNIRVKDDSLSADRYDLSIDVRQLDDSTKVVDRNDTVIQPTIETQPLDLPIDVANQPDMTLQFLTRPQNLGISAKASDHSHIIEDIYRPHWEGQLSEDNGTSIQFELDILNMNDLPAFDSDPNISTVTERAIELACLHQRLHHTDRISSCFPTIAEYAKSRNISKLTLLKSLESAAWESEERSDLSRSVATFRLVTAGYEQIHGINDPRPLHKLCHLARVLGKMTASEEASSLYRTAISGFERLGLHSRQLQYQGVLGDLLLRIGKDTEAIDLYISTFVSYLKTFLPGLNSYTSGFRCLLKYLSEFYLVIKSHNGMEAVARSAILHILDGVGNGDRTLEGSTSQLSVQAVLVFHSTKWAREYSVLRSFDTAETLFLAILQRFDGSWTDVDCTIVRATTSMEYALHCQRRGFRKMSDQYFLLAHEYLVKWEKEEVDLEEMLKSHLAEVQKQLGPGTPEILTRKVSSMLSPLSNSTYLYASNGSIESSEQDRPRALTPRITDKSTALPTSVLSPSSTDSVENEDENAPQMLTLKIRDIFADFPTSAFWRSSNGPMKSCADSTDTKSYKYGVTYSASEVTGISYSEFMVP